MSLPIIHNIPNCQTFYKLLEENPGVLIIKFGATWCGPCKMIESDVNFYFSKMPENVQCVLVDVDKSKELYAFLKTKRMLPGVPAILCYYKGNLNYIPDEFVIGANKSQIINLFTMCYQKAVTKVTT